MKVKATKSNTFKSAAFVEDDDSDSDSGKGSDNNNDNNDDNNTDNNNDNVTENNDTTNSFECPPGFQQVEISKEDEPLYLDDVQGSAELWLIKAPYDFDAKKLDGVNVSLSGRQFLDEDDDSEISYELHASKNMASDMRLPHLLLPSQRGKRAKLVPAPAFTGSLAVMETVAIPPVLLPPSPPKRLNELPPGLKQRFRPFGWEDPKTCVLRSNRSSDVADSSGQKTRKKKSHKHKKSPEEAPLAASPTDEDLTVGHGDEERLPPGIGEGEKGDDDEGVTGGKKAHRRSKKRKHQQREDIEVEKSSEETPKKKKKKKKHKDMTE